MPASPILILKTLARGRLMPRTLTHFNFRTQEPYVAYATLNRISGPKPKALSSQRDPSNDDGRAGGQKQLRDTPVLRISGFKGLGLKQRKMLGRPAL